MYYNTYFQPDHYTRDDFTNDFFPHTLYSSAGFQYRTTDHYSSTHFSNYPTYFSNHHPTRSNHYLGGIRADA